MSDGRTPSSPAKGTARRPTPLDVQIGQLIRARRQVLGWRQEDLARKLDISTHQLQKYEVGDNRIAASRLVECARVLDVPVVWFYQTTQHPSQLPKAADGLASDERELLDSYRNLPRDGRTHLIGIARLLHGEPGKPTRKSKRS